MCQVASSSKKPFKMSTMLFLYPKLILEIKIRILEGWQTKKNNLHGLKSIILKFSGMKKIRDQNQNSLSLQELEI